MMCAAQAKDCPRTVAILEDDLDAAEALSLILADWGCTTVLGVTAGEVLQQLGKTAADLRWIISDFHLGPQHPNGVEAITELRQSAPNARILLLTSSFKGGAAKAAAQASIDVMYKPAREDEILAWLKRG